MAFGIAKHLQCEVNDMDMANMTFGFDIDLDYGLYMKDSKETKKAKRRRNRDMEKMNKRKRTTSNMGMRESRDSFRGSATSGFGGKGYLRDKSESRNDNRDNQFMSSRQSNKRGVNMNKAHISQTKFELNPPGLDQGNSFTSVNNGVVLIMNQSQRDYYNLKAQGG